MWAGELVQPGIIGWKDVPGYSYSDLAPGEILVHMDLGGICGSDIEPFVTGLDLAGTQLSTGQPLHEIVGTVVESRDPDIAAGAQVVGWANSTDGLAEYVVTFGSDVAVVHGLAAQDAIVAQPLACVFAALDRISHDWLGEHVAVLGLGPIGLLFAELLAHRGVELITGVDPVRRIENVEAFGVNNHVEDTAENWATSIHEQDQPRIIIEAIGHQDRTLTAAVKGAAPWGEIYYFGVPSSAPYEIDMVALLRKHLTIRSGTTAVRRREYLERALEYLRLRPQLSKSLTTDIFPVTHAQHAYELAERQPAGHGKVLIQMCDI